MRVEKEELGAEELLRRVDQMLVAVKEEPETSYSDRIRSKIQDDEEEDSMDEMIRRKILADDEEEEEEDNAPTRPTTPVKSSETRETEDEDLNLNELVEIVEKTKSAAKKALAAKNSEIDELKGEIMKHKLEKDSYREKYDKYKKMAQAIRQNSSAARVREVEEANRDIKEKAELREKLLNEEREMREELEQKAELREKMLNEERATREKVETRMKLLIEKVKTSEKRSDRQGLIMEMCATVSERVQVKPEKETESKKPKVKDDVAKKGNINDVKIPASDSDTKKVEIKKKSTPTVAKSMSSSTEEVQKKVTLGTKPKAKPDKLDNKEKDDLEKLLTSSPEKVESSPVTKLSMKAKVDIAKTKPLEEAAEAAEGAPRAAMMLLLDRVLEHEDADGRILSEHFWKLPTRAAMPDYYKVVRRPMDLARLRQRVEEGRYRDLAAFEKDFILMCDNARRFNKDESVIFQDSVTLQALFLKEKQLIEEGEGKGKERGGKEKEGEGKEKVNEAAQEADVPAQEAAKPPLTVSKKFPGLSLANTKKEARVSETPAKKPKKLPSGISFNSTKEEVAPETPKRQVARVEGKSLSIKQAAPPAATDSPAKPVNKLLANPSLSIGKPAGSPARANTRALGISIKKKADAEPEEKDAIAEGSCEDDDAEEDATEETTTDTTDDSAAEGGAADLGMAKYDDLLSRIKGQLKEIGS